MKFDVSLLTHDLSTIGENVQAAERMGFDGFWISETNHDPFLGLTLAADQTSKIGLGTAIAVAFPRSPTILAQTAWDLSRQSNGRFILGLGTQVKAHNVLRFGVKWEKPVKKMRETIQAIRAVWHCWQTGEPLDFTGEFFTLQLMTPFFNPGPNETPTVPIYIAAVNKQMLRLAGELCDGVHLHALHSVPYLEQIAYPYLAEGLAKNGRSRESLAVNTAVFAIPTDDPTYARWAEQHARQQISFYMSTPAYRLLADLHGWNPIADKLSKMARQGAWAQMPAQITDEMLDIIAVTGKWADLPQIIHQKYGPLLDRVSYYLPFQPDTQQTGWRDSINAFKQLA